MSERLPWFRCFPTRLLGALAGMEPDEGYVYVTVLMRIYEAGGPVAESARSLHRRTGLAERKITSALVSLIASGRIIQGDDGRLDSPTTHDELSWQNLRRQEQSRAGRASAAKRSNYTAQNRENAEGEKPKENQQNQTTDVERASNQEEGDKEKDLFEANASNTMPGKPGRVTRFRKPEYPNDFPPDAFERWYALYPRKEAPKAARKAFMRVEKTGEITFAKLMAGTQAYAFAAAGKERQFIKQPTTWLNGGCWADDHGKAMVGNTIATREQFAAQSGRRYLRQNTPQFEAWSEWLRARGSSVPTDRDGGWWFDSEWPPPAQMRAAE